jgi:hypothetical protein
MKRMLIAFAAAAGLAVIAPEVSADPGGFTPPKANGGGASMGTIGGPGTLIGAGTPADRPPDCYGWSPCFKKLFSFGKRKQGPDYGSAGYGMGGPAYNPAGYPPGANQMMQGTLVFPHQTFVRSPRDYFMLDLNK